MKLCTAVNASDSHAIDIKYHKKCWVTNVTNVLQRPPSSAAQTNTLHVAASEIVGGEEYTNYVRLAEGT